MRLYFTACVPLFCLTPALTAQFTITDANVSYTNTITAQVGGGAATSADFAVSTCTPDHLWGNQWCFSVSGSNAGQVFDNVGNGGYSQVSPSADTSIQQLTNVATLGLFDATITDIVTSTGPASGQLLSTLSVVNTSAGTITLKLYHFCDIDFNNSNAPDFSLPNAGPQNFIIGDNMPCGGCISFKALTPADHFECGDWFAPGGPAAANIIAGADLADQGLPFSGAAPTQDDWCGAFQWNVTLAPGATGTAVIQLDIPTSGTPGTTANLGVAVGGAGGPPVMGVSSPRVGREFSVRFTNGGSATSATILLGFDGAPSQTPVFGLQLMTPVSGIVTTFPIALTAGSGQTSFVIGCDLALNGLPMCMQGFVVDPTSPAVLPLAHTDMIVATIGD